MIADFEDAFHTLGVAPEEWKYLLARHPVCGFVGYRTVLCGGAGCPLLWGARSGLPWPKWTGDVWRGRGAGPDLCR